MAVPDYFRKVPHPVSTIVEYNSCDGPNRFAIRERVSTKYTPGSNPQPRNGRVIGHIRDGQFVSKQDTVAASVPDMLSYGASAFVRSVTRDILDDITGVYAIKDAYTIMAVATLRISLSRSTGSSSKTPVLEMICQYFPIRPVSKAAGM